MPGRISQRSMYDSALANLQRGLARVQQQQERLSSGKAIARPSESPVATRDALRLRGAVRRADQLARNADDGLAWLGAADGALRDAGDALRRARDLGQIGINASLTDTDRRAMAIEVDQLRQSLLSTANARYLGQAVFAGTSGGADAYAADGTYLGNATTVARAVAPGVDAEVSVTGTTVFGPTGNDAFAALAQLAEHLRNDPSGLVHDLTRLDAALQRVQDGQAVVGSRFNRVQTARDQVSTRRGDDVSSLATIEGVDLPAAVMDLQLQETAYQAALGATARVIQPSLVDFLR